MARHISAVGASMRQPHPINNFFETVTEERPMTLSEALSSGYLAFDRSTVIAPTSAQGCLLRSWH